MAETVYVAFGSNIGDGVENIKAAAAALDSVPGITLEKLSDIYTTKPWGYEEQADFCNACARLSVTLSPEAVLGVCLGIEAGMGRIREFRNGPRIIDIDVIIYIGQERNTEELVLPHPRMNERDFVLVPLLDVAEGSIKDGIEESVKKLKCTYIVR